MDARLAELPAEVWKAMHGLRWERSRKHRQILIRPQDCRSDVDTRLGRFWHRDIDVNTECAPTWEDMILHVVSFGGVAGTDFAKHEQRPNFGESPKLDCYTDSYAALMNQEGVEIEHDTIPDRQVATYRSWDWHRAGRVYQPGWRLVMIGIESDHLQPKGKIV